MWIAVFQIIWRRSCGFQREFLRIFLEPMKSIQIWFCFIPKITLHQWENQLFLSEVQLPAYHIHSPHLGLLNPAKISLEENPQVIYYIIYIYYTLQGLLLWLLPIKVHLSSTTTVMQIGKCLQALTLWNFMTHCNNSFYLMQLQSKLLPLFITWVEFCHALTSGLNRTSLLESSQ